MTTKEIQDIIATWQQHHNQEPQNEFTCIAKLSEAVGELTKTVATKESMDSLHYNTRLSRQLSEVFWRLSSMASHADIDLGEAFIDNLNSK